MEFQPRATPATNDAFLRAYLKCAEWCGPTEEDREALQQAASPAWSETALNRARRECEDFAENYHPVGEAAGLSDEQAGGDFWLTRNGHGAGFWDRGIGKAGDVLTEAAHSWGECNVVFDSATEELDMLG